MSIIDQKNLIRSIHPFELLSSNELDALSKKIDIAYYPKDTLLISKDLEPVAFYIIIKGIVDEYIDGEIHNTYTQEDSFDADFLIYSTCNSKFIVEEDLICYEIKRDDFLELLQNKEIQSYYLKDFVSRHQHLKEYNTQSDLSDFLIAKIEDIFLHSACIVEPSTSILEALKLQDSQKANVLIVGDSAIVTDSDIRKRVLLEQRDIHESISTIATNNLVSIEKSDFLFNALLLMTHNEIKRLIVTENGKIVGVLEQLDMLSYFANHSHLVNVQIDKATNIDELKAIDIDNIIVILKAKGLKARYISKLISTINEKLYKKVFDLCVDKDLQKKCSLIIMGSEGRREQIIKSDQDNALVISDSVDKTLFEQPMKKLNSYLLELGFEKCPGNVMVSNEFWRKHKSEYQNDIKSWINTLDESSLQNLSIFLDAICIAGDKQLLDELKEYLYEKFESRDDILAHLAKAVINFETPLGIFSKFIVDKNHDNEFDIKKGGIFAIVHSARILALKHKIMQTNTIERIKELNNKNVFDKSFATELIESFDTLSTIRLQAMLEAHDKNSANYIDPKELSKIQRDLLKDSLKIVNKLKKFMTYHFHLEMVS
jgi:CBS domain-containing protein